jgi:hypothetical protein
MFRDGAGIVAVPVRVAGRASICVKFISPFHVFTTPPPACNGLNRLATTCTCLKRPTFASPFQHHPARPGTPGPDLSKAGPQPHLAARKVSHWHPPPADFHRYRRLPAADQIAASRESDARVPHTSLAGFARTPNVTRGKTLAILPRWRGREGGQLGQRRGPNLGRLGFSYRVRC